MAKDRFKPYIHPHPSPTRHSAPTRVRRWKDITTPTHYRPTTPTGEQPSIIPALETQSGPPPDITSSRYDHRSPEPSDTTPIEGREITHPEQASQDEDISERPPSPIAEEAMAVDQGQSEATYLIRLRDSETTELLDCLQRVSTTYVQDSGCC